MKTYQRPFVGTIIKDGLSFRCQATPNCNANITSCDPPELSDILIQDCEFTACVGTFTFQPDENGFLTFDCGPGTGPFTADFVTVTPDGVCNNGQLRYLITVDITPALPDTCNGNTLEYWPDGVNIEFGCGG